MLAMRSTSTDTTCSGSETESTCMTEDEDDAMKVRGQLFRDFLKK